MILLISINKFQYNRPKQVIIDIIEIDIKYIDLKIFIKFICKIYYFISLLDIVKFKKYLIFFQPNES